MARGMLPLPVLAAAMILGVLLAGQYEPSRAVTGAIRTAAALVLLLALCAATAPEAPRRSRILALLAGGLCAGGLAVPASAPESSGAPIGDDRTIEGEICGLDRGFRGIELILCDVIDVEQRRRLGKLLVLVEEAETADLPTPAWRVGECYRLGVRFLSRGDARNPGAREAAFEARARRGITGRARLLDPASAVRRPDLERAGMLERAASTGHAHLLATRTHVADALTAAGPGGGLLATLALGMRGGVGVAEREAFGRLGIAHVLAVSGLHLALVIGAAHWLLARLVRGLPRLLARLDPRPGIRLAAVCCGAAYALMCGFGLPMQRALIFAVAWLIGTLCARRIGAVQVLALAVVLLLWHDPAALFDPGAHLSFAAASALLLAPRRAPAPSRACDRESLIRRGVREAAKMLETSAICIAVTAPILAGLARPTGLPGLVANPIVLPWTGVVLLPASLIASLAILADAPGAPLILGLAERCAAFTLSAVAAGAAPWPDPGYAAPPIAWVRLLSGVGAMAAVYTASPRLRLALTIGIVILLGLAPTRGAGDRLPPAPRLIALDVGQGDASLVQGRGGNLLIDAGRAGPGEFDAGAQIVVPALRTLGVRRLDLVVASHADIDHRGGLVAVLRTLEVGALWLPRGGASDPGFAPLLDTASARRVPVREVSSASESQVIGDLMIEVLSPPPELRGASRNDDSVVLRVEVDGTFLLLMADVGREVEAELVRGGRVRGAAVLKAGHHGSGTSSSPAFLRAVAPELAIVSSPCGGRAGLPSRAALARLEAAGIAIAWTGRDGAIGVGLGRTRRGAKAALPLRTFAARRHCIVR